MKLDADRQGFLKGVPLDDGEAERLLRGIKGDTGRILSLLRGSAALSPSRGRPQAMAAAVPASARAAASRASGAAPTAVPSRRAGATSADRARDPVTGRFTRAAAPTGASGRAAAAQSERRTERMAQAAEAMARTAEAQRRDDKADRAMRQQRGADGRFGAGEGGGSALGEGISGALGASANALDRSEQLDPLIGAIGEVRGVADAARAVVAPIGRAGAGMFGALRGRGESDPPERRPVGWLRRLWRELRLQRRDEAKAAKDTRADLRKLGQKRAAGEGGGFLDSVVGLLPALPRIAAAVGALIPAAITAATVAVANKLADSFVSAMIDKVPSWMGGDKLRGARDAGVLGTNLLNPFAAPGRPSSNLPPEQQLLIAANRAGVDSNLVLNIARKESGLNPDARPMGPGGVPMSSAHGLGQFTDSTWVDAVKRWGEKYGVAGASGMSAEQALALRGDSGLQASLLAELTGENAGRARRAFGRNDPAAVYAMHVLGAGSGDRFLRAARANAQTPLSSLLSADEIGNNPSLFRGKATVGEAMQAMSEAMGATASRSPRAAAMPATARPATPSAPSAPRVPSAPAMPSTPAPPSVDSAPSAPLSGRAMPAVPQASAPVGQDVRDRTIAHVTTGGIGGASPHR